MRWINSAFRRSVVIGAFAGGGAVALSCSPSGHDSTVNGSGEAGASTSVGGTTGTTGGKGTGNTGPNLGGNIAAEMPDGPCQGLECQVATCTPGVTTTITGKVYDPAGKVPLYNVIVYVPNAPVPAFTPGASCDRCGASVTNPVTSAITDETGSFKLEKAPSGENIPLVIQVGKWRRQVVVPAVTSCVDTPLTDPQLTRLPRNKAEGDIPLIAIAAGGADQMECLPRRLGIDDAEFTSASGDGRIHLYSGHDDGASGANHPINATSAGPLTPATNLWTGVDNLKKYDIVILSCEGGSYPDDKPMPTRQALYDYASLGGRVFASHWHDIWFAEGPAPLPTTGTWSRRPDPPNEAVPTTATINQTFPKGEALAKWLVNVGASTTQGQISVTYPRDNIQAANATVAREWITLENSNPEINGDPTAVQYMSFNTPIGVPEEQVCGREVYTNLHVAAIDSDDPTRNPTFPLGCAQRDLTAQEKVVAFMLFDLSACVMNDDEVPKPPK